MIIYLIVINISSLLIHILEKYWVKKSYFIYFLLTLLSIIGISVFSGIRNLQVGMDIGVYGQGIFDTVKSFGI